MRRRRMKTALLLTKATLPLRMKAVLLLRMRAVLLPCVLAALVVLGAVAAASVATVPGLPAAGEPSAAGGGRILFRVTAAEVGASGRRPLFDATVEGPEGTDFTVNMQDARFRMVAKFLTDAEPGGGGLRLRAKLDTRRLYGYSENSLPLYEEDSQSRALRVGFDESVVLLPFGGGGDERLEIEISPERVARPWRLPSGEMSPPEIRVGRPSPGGVINVEATKIPHHFVADAALFEDGREVARGSARCLIEEPSEIALRPGSDAPAALALALNVERFEPAQGKGRAALRFDLLRGAAGVDGRREVLARNWAGVTSLGSEVVYDLTDVYKGAPGKKYELRLRIDLARGE